MAEKLIISMLRSYLECWALLEERLEWYRKRRNRWDCDGDGLTRICTICPFPLEFCRWLCGISWNPQLEMWIFWSSAENVESLILGGKKTDKTRIGQSDPALLYSASGTACMCDFLLKNIALPLLEEHFAVFLQGWGRMSRGICMD